MPSIGPISKDIPGFREGAAVDTYFYNGVTDRTNVTSGIVPAGTYQVNRISTSTPRFRKSKIPVMNIFHFGETTKMFENGYYRSDFAYPNVYFYPDISYRYMNGVMTTNFSPEGLTFSAYEEQNLESRAINECLLKMKDQSVNLAVVMGERQQTIKLLVTTVKRIGAAYGGLRRGNFLAAATALGLKIRGDSIRSYLKRFRRDQESAIAGGWLELQYGWLPLLSDVYGSLDAFNKGFKDEGSVIRVSKTKSLEKSLSTSSTSGVETIIEEKHSRHEVKCVLYYTVDNPLTKELSELGITNPLYLAWELTRFSFVIDWFIPIGNYLSSFDSTLGCSFGSGCITHFTKLSAVRTRTGSTPRSTPAGYKWYNSYQGRITSSSESVSCHRTLFSSFPPPQIPLFKDPMSMVHFANALALLKTNLRK